MAQPPLSQSVRQLEREIGARLFDRTSRSVALTDVGKVLLEEARRTIAQMDHAIAVARSVASGKQGSLRVGFMNSATYGLLPLALRHFRDRHREVDVELFESNSTDMMISLASNELDVCLLGNSPGLARKLEVETVFADRLVAALASDHPLSRRRTLTLKMLANDPFIMFSAVRSPATIYQQTIAACREAAFMPAVKQRISTIQSVLSLVAGGAGVALVPSAARNGAPPGVALIPLRDRTSTLRIEIAAAYRRDRSSPLFSAFVESARTVGATLAPSR